MHRGTITLNKNTKVNKTGKDRFEIITEGRTYYLSESDNSKLTVDAWVENIRHVISTLR
jgi:hypothetical protein